MSVIGDILSPVTQFATGIINNRQQKKLQQKEHQHQLNVISQEQQFNRELAQYQHQKNLEMWELNNRYNSPEQQMKRYQDAGINPNLIYGNISSGNSNSIPKYQEAGTDYSGLKRVNMHVNNWDFLNDVLQKLYMYEDHKNTQAIKKATAKNLDARTATESVNKMLKSLDAEIKGLEKEWKGADASRKRDIHQEWLDNKERRSLLMDYQLQKAMYDARLTENKAFGITDNPSSWVGILNNTVNSWIRENGGKGSYSQEMGKFIKQLNDKFDKALNWWPNTNKIFNLFGDK